MKDILAQIVEDKFIEVEAQKSQLPLRELAAAAKDMPAVRSMSSSLAASASGIIAEFKRRSPSKGWIAESAESSVIPAAYSAAGASAISILTDLKYFGGTLKDIEAARPMVDVPILRKEFIVDEYQLYQARLVGADAVLLIASALTSERCGELTDVARHLGLEVLLELHGEHELHYVERGVEMVGVNNRNLGTFHTDIANSYRLMDLLPGGVVKVSESGISSPDTVSELRAAGYRGFLIGENFMRAENPGDALREFIEKVR